MQTKEQLERARLLSVKDFPVKIVEARKTLFALEQEKILGKLKDTNQIRRKKREIARLATVLDEKVTQMAKQDNA